MFNQEDFKEHHLKLLIIIMSLMPVPLLTPYKSLNERQQVYFNEELNRYIRALPEDKEEWLEVLDDDFNKLTNQLIFNDNFDPTKVYVPDVNVNIQLLSKEEAEAKEEAEETEEEPKEA